jgi:hypothetical protein
MNSHFQLDIERGVLALDRLVGGDAAERAIGIEQMGAHPGQRAEANDDQQRGGPDHQLKLGGVIPLRLVGCRGVGLAVAPGEEDGQRHHRKHDDEHQDGRDDDEVALLGGDVARRRQDDEIAPAKKRRERQ